MAKPKKGAGGSSIADWTRVIRKASEDSRALEEARQAEARAFIQRLREADNTFPELIRALLKAHDEDGILRTNELLDELRYIVDNT
jgi:hypothetical protein